MKTILVEIAEVCNINFPKASSMLISSDSVRDPGGVDNRLSKRFELKLVMEISLECKGTDAMFLESTPGRNEDLKSHAITIRTKSSAVEDALYAHASVDMINFAPEKVLDSIKGMCMKAGYLTRIL